MKVYIGTLLSFLFLVTSCIQMEEVHQEYISDGEIIYRAKPQDIIGYSGLNQAKLTWKLVSPRLVDRCEIRMGEQLLAEIPVEYQDTVRLEYLLKELEEKTYTFALYSLDANGNSSIKSEVIVEVYGSQYLSTLRTNTSLESVWRKMGNEETVSVKISERTSSKLVGTNIYYLDTAGKEQCFLIDATSTTAVLENVAANSYFKLQDLYQPSENCIDSFPAPVVEYTADELPVVGSRRFATVYRLDEQTVYGVLTNAEEGTLKTVVTCGEQEIEVDPGTNSITLENVKSTDVITLKTILQSGEEAVEYIAPVQSYPVSELTVKLNMSEWAVIDFSSEQASEGKAVCAIDNQLSTYWHTQYSPNQPGYPHYITVDMKQEQTINAIAVARRQGNNNIASRFLLEVSTDNNNWVSAGKFSVDSSIDGLQFVKLESAVTGRYFRLTGESSATSNTFMCIGEINLFR